MNLQLSPSRPVAGRRLPPPVRLRRVRLIVGAMIVLGDISGLWAGVAVSDVALVWGLLFSGMALAVLALRGHYRVRISPLLTEEAGALAGCLALPLLAVAVVAGGAAAAPVLRMGAIAIGLLLGARAVTYTIVRTGRARGWLVEPTLVIGAGRVGAELVQLLHDHPSYGLRPVGFLDGFDDAELPAPMLGSVDRLDSVLREHCVSRVIIAFGATRDPDMVKIVRSCRRASVEIHVLPRLFELGVDARGAKVDKVWGLPLVRLQRSAFRSGAWRIKRVIDVAVAGTGLLVIAPLYGAIVAAIRLTSRGPALFRQERVGQDGRLITVLKFRSMVVNADSDSTWSVARDSRVTPVGQILRKTGLDELPQLWNVARGDMSLVGPRPERPRFVRDFRVKVASYDDRLRVPPGITGSAQIHGLRGDTSISERTRFDNQYIENWSLWQDVFIIFRTVRTFFGFDHGGDARLKQGGRARRLPLAAVPRGGAMESPESRSLGRGDQANATSVA
jgi:exopolysaccharide biosynthesis polyprenyl glycosylphosphotransferase